MKNLSVLLFFLSLIQCSCSFSMNSVDNEKVDLDAYYKEFLQLIKLPRFDDVAGGRAFKLLDEIESSCQDKGYATHYLFFMLKRKAIEMLHDPSTNFALSVILKTDVGLLASHSDHNFESPVQGWYSQLCNIMRLPGIMSSEDAREALLLLDDTEHYLSHVGTISSEIREWLRYWRFLINLKSNDKECCSLSMSPQELNGKNVQCFAQEVMKARMTGYCETGCAYQLFCENLFWRMVNSPISDLNVETINCAIKCIEIMKKKDKSLNIFYEEILFVCIERYCEHLMAKGAEDKDSCFMKFFRLVCCNKIDEKRLQEALGLLHQIKIQDVSKAILCEYVLYWKVVPFVYSSPEQRIGKRVTCNEVGQSVDGLDIDVRRKLDSYCRDFLILIKASNFDEVLGGRALGILSEIEKITKKHTKIEYVFRYFYFMLCRKTVQMLLVKQGGKTESNILEALSSDAQVITMCCTLFEIIRLPGVISSQDFQTAATLLLDIDNRLTHLDAIDVRTNMLLSYLHLIINLKLYDEFDSALTMTIKKDSQRERMCCSISECQMPQAQKASEVVMPDGSAGADGFYRKYFEYIVKHSNPDENKINIAIQLFETISKHSSHLDLHLEDALCRCIESYCKDQLLQSMDEGENYPLRFFRLIFLKHVDEKVVQCALWLLEHLKENNPSLVPLCEILLYRKIDSFSNGCAARQGLLFDFEQAVSSPSDSLKKVVIKESDNLTTENDVLVAGAATVAVNENKNCKDESQGAESSDGEDLEDGLLLRACNEVSQDADQMDAIFQYCSDSFMDTGLSESGQGSLGCENCLKDASNQCKEFESEDCVKKQLEIEKEKSDVLSKKMLALAADLSKPKQELIKKIQAVDERCIHLNQQLESSRAKNEQLENRLKKFSQKLQRSSSHAKVPCLNGKGQRGDLKAEVDKHKTENEKLHAKVQSLAKMYQNLQRENDALGQFNETEKLKLKEKPVAQVKREREKELDGLRKLSVSKDDEIRRLKKQLEQHKKSLKGLNKQ